MKTVVYPDYETLCAGVADTVVAQLEARPDSVVVFPTGNTPLGLFKRLVELHKSGAVNFGRAHVVILDEYAGLGPSDPRSLTDWLRHELLTPVGVPVPNIHGFENGPEALEKKIVDLGGLDLAILGLGPNGHLGFNEPGSPFECRSRKIALTAESITSNATYWGSEDRVPRHGFTLGLETLSEARSLILMVSGSSKRKILSKTLDGNISPSIPASILTRLVQTKLFADQAAIPLSQ